MIDEIRIDLQGYFDRGSWGILYCENDIIIDSDYCDDEDDVLSSLSQHQEQLVEYCHVAYIISAFIDFNDMQTLVEVIDSLNDQLRMRGLD